MKYLLAASLFVLVVSGPRAHADVKFEQLSFEAACKRAAKEHKSVMVDVYTDWCHWCKVLDQKTYTDKAVAAYADEHLIAIKINAEQGDGVAFAQKAAVHGFPTVIFFDEAGAESYRVGGYEPPTKFLTSMTVGTMGSLSTLEARVEQNPTDARAAFALAERYNSTSNPAKAVELYTRVVVLDTNNKLHLAEQAALPLAYASLNAGSTGALESFLQTYPAATVNVDIHEILMETYLRKQDVENARIHFSSLRTAHPEDYRLVNAFAWECATNKVYLDSALAYTETTVANAKDPGEKAVFLGTRAEVLFAMKKLGDAIRTDKDALALLPREQKYDRLRADLQRQLKKITEATLD